MVKMNRAGENGASICGVDDVLAGDVLLDMNR